MERSTWSDDRLDDLVASTDTRFELLHEELRSFRVETREELREFRSDFSALQRQIIQLSWTLAAALIAAIAALIATA